MSSSATQSRRFTCTTCRRSFDEWKARCPSCQAWMTRTARPTAPAPAAPAPSRRPPTVEDGEPEAPAADEARAQETREARIAVEEPPWSTPVPITEVESVTERRVITGIEPLDRVLGGGFVPGHLIMVSGDPGSGKSTLLAQVAGSISCERLLYATGEESIQAVADRSRRVGCAFERIRVVRETIAERVISHAETLGAQVLVIDSMQTLVSRSAGGSPAGTVQQIEACTTELMALSQRTMMTTIAIVHMTKDGNYAGPKRLEHMFDVALHLSKDPDSEVRYLRCPGKNRGGSTMEVGSFLMTASGLEPLLPGEGADEPRDQMLPIAQELLYRLLESGGTVDAGLLDRIAGRLDTTPRTR